MTLIKSLHFWVLVPHLKKKGLGPHFQLSFELWHKYSVLFISTYVFNGSDSYGRRVISTLHVIDSVGEEDSTGALKIPLHYYCGHLSESYWRG